MKIEASPRHKRLIGIYDAHPLTANAIIQRLQQNGHVLNHIRAIDLSVDAKTGVTDQNNPGGLASALKLGDLIQLDQNKTVLDIGCGLGGTARLIAEKFGSQVHGIDLTPSALTKKFFP